MNKEEYKKRLKEINKELNKLTWKDLKGIITDAEKKKLIKLNTEKSKLLINGYEENIKKEIKKLPNFDINQYKKEWGTYALVK